MSGFLKSHRTTRCLFEFESVIPIVPVPSVVPVQRNETLARADWEAVEFGEMGAVSAGLPSLAGIACGGESLGDSLGDSLKAPGNLGCLFDQPRPISRNMSN